MKFFSGFCLYGEKFFFNDFIEENEFTVSGFSYGAQKALDFVLNSKTRIDKLKLFSPAFFNTNKKFIQLNIKAFEKDKISYIEKFLTKAGIDKMKTENEKWKIDYSCDKKELEKLFTFDWKKIKKIKNIKIEVFVGEYDKIICVKKAYEFFKEYANVYLIKKANHFLRS